MEVKRCGKVYECGVRACAGGGDPSVAHGAEVSSQRICVW
jgi:hypothetical protein